MSGFEKMMLAVKMWLAALWEYLAGLKGPPRGFAMLLGFCLAMCVSIFAVLGASADTVPYNGCFSGSISGWKANSTVNSTWDAGGHGGCGAYKTNYGDYLQSRPMVSVGSSTAVVWAKATNPATNFLAYVLNWDTGVRTQVGASVVLTTTQYISYTYDLSPWVANVAVVFYCSNGCYISDVGVTNASNTVFGSYGLNGAAAPQEAWTMKDGGPVLWSGVVGHNALGSFYTTAGLYQWMRPFQTGGTTAWEFWAKGAGTKTVYLAVFDFDAFSRTVFYNGNYDVTAWQRFPFDLSGFGSHVISFELGNSDLLYYDDVCPQSGCVYTPPPTPGTPTETPVYFPYGPGTPVPVTSPQ